MPGRAPEQEIRAALHAASAYSSYFACEIGNPDGDWLPLRELYEQPEILRRVVEATAARIGTPEFRVALSTFQLGLSARLFSLSLGCLASRGVVPDLAADRLHWRTEEGATHLRLDPVGGWQGDGAEAVALHQLRQDHLLPLVATAQAESSLSPRVLWSNAVAALRGAVGVIERGGPATIGDVADDWIARSPDLRSGLATDTDRRAACCLYYRISARLCGNCPLSRPPNPSRRKDSA